MFLKSSQITRTRVAAALVFLSCSSVHAQTRRSVQAIPVQGTIEVDGEFHEAEWKSAPPATDFIQAEPLDGQPSTERTEVRLLYDRQTLYLGVTCYESGSSRRVAREMKRDFDNENEDSVEVLIDSFHDLRNAFLFVVNPWGAQADAQIAEEGTDINRDWDGVWYAKVRRLPDRWQAELAIPFRTLRLKPGQTSSMGLNVLRRIRWKNELAYWSPVPRRYEITRVSLAGDLNGLREVEGQRRNLRIKPFGLGEVRQSIAPGPVDQSDADLRTQFGLDVKYGLTRGLTLDLTVNTDFAEIEVDEQQVNLTRFPLFFPEKRDFFLENAGVFQFGVPRRRPGARAGGGSLGPEEPLFLFFSRRIGLSDDGTTIPIAGGARLTGRVGPYNLGLLAIRTKKEDSISANTFTVARLKRDILNNSTAGFMFISRDSSLSGDFNRTFGVDTNLQLGQQLSILAFLAKTQTPGMKNKDWAGQIGAQWQGPVLQFGLSYTDLQDNFNPEVGFVQRKGIRRGDGVLHLRFRPFHSGPVRELNPHQRTEYTTAQDNSLLTRKTHNAFAAFFRDGGSLEIAYNTDFERLLRPFEVRPPVVIPPGDYRFNDWLFLYRSDGSRKVSGSVRLNRGDFYSGKRTATEIELRYRPNHHLGAAVAWQRNDVDLAQGAFTTDVVRFRGDYNFTTSMFLNGLIQVNTSTREILSNIRFNLIHRPLSDLFIVYSELRDTNGSTVRDRALTLKFTYLFDF